MDIATIFSLIMRGVGLVQTVMGDRKAASGLDVFATIKKDAPEAIDILTQLGQHLFPNLNSSQQPQAAATAVDTATVAKIQAALNARLPTGTPVLDVDGAYGPKTRAAVLAFQQANGLTADEWAGPLTQQALGVA